MNNRRIEENVDRDVWNRSSRSQMWCCSVFVWNHLSRSKRDHWCWWSCEKLNSRRSIEDCFAQFSFWLVNQTTNSLLQIWSQSICISRIMLWHLNKNNQSKASSPALKPAPDPLGRKWSLWVNLFILKSARRELSIWLPASLHSNLHCLCLLWFSVYEDCFCWWWSSPLPRPHHGQRLPTLTEAGARGQPLLQTIVH